MLLHSCVLIIINISIILNHFIVLKMIKYSNILNYTIETKKWLKTEFRICDFQHVFYRNAIQPYYLVHSCINEDTFWK